MIVHQVWYETSVGPTFSTKEKAIEWLTEDGEEWNEGEDYPGIEEITVDDQEFWRDR